MNVVCVILLLACALTVHVANADAHNNGDEYWEQSSLSLFDASYPECHDACKVDDEHRADGYKKQLEIFATMKQAVTSDSSDSEKSVDFACTDRDLLFRFFDLGSALHDSKTSLSLIYTTLSESLKVAEMPLTRVDWETKLPDMGCCNSDLASYHDRTFHDKCMKGVDSTKIRQCADDTKKKLLAAVELCDDAASAAFTKLRTAFNDRGDKTPESSFMTACEAQCKQIQKEQNSTIRRLFCGLFGAVVVTLGVGVFLCWRGRRRPATDASASDHLQHDPRIGCVYVQLMGHYLLTTGRTVGQYVLPVAKTVCVLALVLNFPWLPCAFFLVLMILLRRLRNKRQKPLRRTLGKFDTLETLVRIKDVAAGVLNVIVPVDAKPLSKQDRIPERLQRIKATWFDPTGTVSSDRQLILSLMLKKPHRFPEVVHLQLPATKLAEGAQTPLSLKINTEAFCIFKRDGVPHMVKTQELTLDNQHHLLILLSDYYGSDPRLQFSTPNKAAKTSDEDSSSAEKSTCIVPTLSAMSLRILEQMIRHLSVFDSMRFVLFLVFPTLSMRGNILFLWDVFWM